ncbi:MAG: iron-containing alcohol dehydrogenase [Candidatus Cloacimonetes bacterium]|nr:iron-containing alcohol dehydrogenase [Candidatus Cloacimonadota bacterium]
MFFCPTRIVFGNNAVQRAAGFIPALGNKALIVTGKKSAQLCGALSDITNMLSSLGIAYATFAEVKENPELQCIMQGKDMLLDTASDFVIGIGGGSPIDAAKAISLAAANSLNISQLYQTELFRDAYPIIAVPTTAGTGTEATQYSVLSDPGTNKKAGFGHPKAFPTLSILDPRYTYSLPQSVTLHTALDALSHLLEGIYSNQRSQVVKPFIHKGISNIIKHLPLVLQQPDNPSSRNELMLASLYGGMVIAQGSTTLQHSIGYPLTATFGVPHGLANALVMQEIMLLYLPAVKAELEELFDAIHLSMDEFFMWLHKLPYNSTIEYDDKFIEASIPQIMNSRNMALNPVTVTEADVYRILDSIRSKK